MNSLSDAVAFSISGSKSARNIFNPPKAFRISSRKIFMPPPKFDRSSPKVVKEGPRPFSPVKPSAIEPIAPSEAVLKSAIPL